MSTRQIGIPGENNSGVRFRTEAPSSRLIQCRVWEWPLVHGYDMPHIQVEEAWSRVGFRRAASHWNPPNRTRPDKGAYPDGGWRSDSPEPFATSRSHCPAQSRTATSNLRTFGATSYGLFRVGYKLFRQSCI